MHHGGDIAVCADVRRVQAILRADAIDANASRYRVVVLNLEIGDPR